MTHRRCVHRPLSHSPTCREAHYVHDPLRVNSYCVPRPKSKPHIIQGPVECVILLGVRPYCMQRCSYPAKSAV